MTSAPLVSPLSGGSVGGRSIRCWTDSVLLAGQLSRKVRARGVVEINGSIKAEEVI